VSTDLKAKELINEFIYCALFPEITGQECPTKLNLLKSLKSHLNSKGIDAITIEELSAKWLPDLIRRVQRRLEDWIRLGVPFPCCQSDEQEGLLVTWKHPKYEELTGYTAISERFIRTLEWIGSLSPKEFLVACAIYLRLLGATKIFITDGPRDGGIDLIARIERTPFNSVIFFVQAKTSSIIARDTVLMEYGKYLSLPHEEIYQKYRKALEVDSAADGASYCYTVFANCEFHNSAKEISSKIGVLLRSKIQIAYFISQALDIDALVQFTAELKAYLKADLSLNIAARLPLLVKG